MKVSITFHFSDLKELVLNYKGQFSGLQTWLRGPSSFPNFIKPVNTKAQKSVQQAVTAVAETDTLGDLGYKSVSIEYWKVFYIGRI